MRPSLTLSVKVCPGPFQKHAIDDCDFDQKLAEFKESAASKCANLPANSIDLVHHGRVLDDGKSLAENGVKPGEIVYVLRKYAPRAPEPPKRITEIEVQECVSFFRCFRHPGETGLTLLLKIRDEGHSESFLSSMPALADDPVAINYLREPELLAHMGDPDTIRKVAEKHPAFIEAIRKISGINDKSFKKMCQMMPSESDEEEDVDVLGDPDDDADDADNSQGGGLYITPEQLQSALLMAGMAAGNGNNSGSQSASTSSSTDTSVPSLREFLGSLLATSERGTAAAESPSSSRSVITSDMFSNALSQAFSAGSGGSGSANTSVSADSAAAMSPEEQASSRQYAEELLKMQEMGLTDKRVNLRALVISDGDVNAAINLVLSNLM